MLTAEQVQRAIHDCSKYSSLVDGTNYYAGGIHIQELVDKLNEFAVKGEPEDYTIAVMPSPLTKGVYVVKKWRDNGDGTFTAKWDDITEKLCCPNWRGENYVKQGTLGVGECKIKTSVTDGLCGDDPKVYYELSCGHRMMLYGLDVPILCAVCGKVVEQ